MSYDEPAGVTVGSPWNLNTDTVTLSAWIYPTAYQQPGAAIVVCSGLGTGFGNVVDVEGLNFTQNGSSDLGYTWNNDTNTVDWDSGLQPPLNQWSFVSLVVTPTDATIYMMNSNGPAHSTFVYPHAVARFANSTMIGDDPGYAADGSRLFNGSIDSVAVYGQALSEAALLKCSPMRRASPAIRPSIPSLRHIKVSTLARSRNSPLRWTAPRRSPTLGRLMAWI